MTTSDNSWPPDLTDRILHGNDLPGRHAIDRDLLVQEIRSYPRWPFKHEVDALRRLLVLARDDSGQRTRVREFLMAWWNAPRCGGFDVMDVGGLDAELAADLVVVFAMIARISLYPSDLSADLVKEFRELDAFWYQTPSDRR